MKRLHEEARQLDEIHLPFPQPWEFVYHTFFESVKNKFFIDVGATNGLNGSNTSLFEFYLNWNGICIEPNTIQYEKLTKNRNCKTYNCCISNTDTIKEFLEVQGPVYALSGLKETYDLNGTDRLFSEIQKMNDTIVKKNIEVKKLSTIMNENNITHVDYLSIDVEGHELNVLEGIDFKNHFIDVISVEDNDPTGKLINFLIDKNYYFVAKVCADLIFKKTTK